MDYLDADLIKVGLKSNSSEEIIKILGGLLKEKRCS